MLTYAVLVGSAGTGATKGDQTGTNCITWAGVLRSPDYPSRSALDPDKAVLTSPSFGIPARNYILGWSCVSS